MEETVEWFLNSEIYVRRKGYRAYYSGPIYPEITAYAITLACILFRRTGKAIFLNRARECADYLRSINKIGGIPSYQGSNLYTFDTGIFISGLLDFYEISKEELYLREATKSLSWLMKYFDGEKFSAVEGHIDPKLWYETSSIHLTKLAIPLIKAWIKFEDEKYKEAAVELLKWAGELQEKNGRFKINAVSDETFTHAHCYAVEGLLFAYNFLRNKNYLEIARKSAEWLSSAQLKDGSFYGWYFEKEGFHKKLGRLVRRTYYEKRLDATAQAIRIWKILGINEGGIERAYSYLEKNSRNGGLTLTHRDSRIYSWPTFFYLHSKMLPYGELSYGSEIF